MIPKTTVISALSKLINYNCNEFMNLFANDKCHLDIDCKDCPFLNEEKAKKWLIKNI